MKLRGHIISVEDRGESLVVVGQGAAVGDAAWRSMERFEFRVASHDRNKRAFHVGRRLAITVEVES